MATSAKDTAKISIEVEARTDVAVAQFEKLQSSTKKAREEVTKLESASAAQTRQMDINRARVENTNERYAAFDKAVKAANASTSASAAAFSKGGAAAQAFGTAIKQVETGQASLRQGVMGVAAAFGPLGIAVGVAGSLLIGLAQDHIEAANAADQQRLALEKLHREEKQKAEEDRKAKFVEDLNNRLGREDMARRQREVDKSADTLRGLEDAFAQHGRGKDMLAFLEEEAKIRAANAQIMGDSAEASRIEREFELTRLGLLGDTLDKEKAVTAEKREQLKLRHQEGTFANALGFTGFKGNVAGESEDRKFESERKLAEVSRVASQIQRDGVENVEAAEKYRENARQERFEREIQRIKDEQSARDEAAESFMRGGEMVADTAAGIASAYLTSGDLSAKGFRKAVGQFTAAEAIRLGVVAIREGILGGVAASNPFTAALAPGHFAAAGQAAAGAAVLGGIAAGLGVASSGAANKNVKGFDGSAFGPGAEVAANDRPSATNSQKDTTPVSEQTMQRQNGAANGPANGRGGGLTVIIPGMTVLGSIDDQSARRIAQGIKRVGGFDGRVT